MFPTFSAIVVDFLGVFGFEGKPESLKDCYLRVIALEKLSKETGEPFFLSGEDWVKCQKYLLDKE
jgi:hypothetical protein